MTCKCGKSRAKFISGATCDDVSCSACSDACDYCSQQTQQEFLAESRKAVEDLNAAAYFPEAPSMPDTGTVQMVGGINSDARGAGARFNAGKTEFHHIPLFALEGAAQVLMYGAKKYKPGNWMKGMPWLTVFDCMMRHMQAWQRGEELDPESGKPHLDHALCNLIFLSAYRDVYPEGDDRWPGMQKGGLPKV